jgi:hypothetical protein
MVVKLDQVKPEDCLGFAFFTGFGLWFVFFPRSVLRFYTRFHGKRITMPDETDPLWSIRLGGAFWVALVLCVMVRFLIYGK